jgi:NAD(P)-dependent dehydrogenase (short-subunit alcohol dehydrogenase family)
MKNTRKQNYKSVVITGADRGLGYSLCEEFLKRNYLVFAGQFMPKWPELAQLRESWEDRLAIIPLDVSDHKSIKEAAAEISHNTDHIDCFVSNAGIILPETDIREGVNQEGNRKTFEVNSLGPLFMTRSLLPLMENGDKRLCYVSSEAGSIAVAHRKDMFGYCMSKAALNMAVRQLHNELFPQGYTFRIYHPGWLKSYMTGDEKMKGEIEPEESAAVAVKQFLEDRTWEEVLAVIDVEGRIWPF